MIIVILLLVIVALVACVMLLRSDNEELHGQNVALIDMLGDTHREIANLKMTAQFRTQDEMDVERFLETL